MSNYKIGDCIFIDKNNFRSEQPFKKLDFKSYDPYFIDKIISPYIY